VNIPAWLGLTLILGGLGLTSPAPAQEIQPFETGSLQKIVAAHQNRPFVLALWSLTCPPCQDELAMLGEVFNDDPACDLVLVSTDTPEEIAALAAALARHHLESAQAWVFADAFTERLRHGIDRQWQGELPRTYLHGADGSIQAVSGKLSRQQLRQWIERQTASAKQP
jgi:thiol-disulfide isomerase/thioredoxin